jgi:hypothetical protein
MPRLITSPTLKRQVFNEQIISDTVQRIYFHGALSCLRANPKLANAAVQAAEPTLVSAFRRRGAEKSRKWRI